MGFLAPILWLPTVIIGGIAIGMRPEGLRTDGRPRTRGLLGWLWDDIAVTLRRPKPGKMNSPQPLRPKIRRLPAQRSATTSKFLLVALCALAGIPAVLMLSLPRTQTPVADKAISTKAPDPSGRAQKNSAQTHFVSTSPPPTPENIVPHSLQLPTSPIDPSRTVQKVQPPAPQDVALSRRKPLLFKSEIARFLKLYDCPAKGRSVSPASEGLNPLFGCIDGSAQTAKYWINASDDGKHVENIKVMWNDWYKDTGFGLHADATQANLMLSALAKLYVPRRLAELQTAFAGQKNVSFTESGYQVEYHYQRGPAIDERLATLTPLPVVDASNPVNTVSHGNAEPQSKPQVETQNSVDNAYAVCAAVDATGLLSSKCSVSGWNQTVDFSIDTSTTDAIRVCGFMAIKIMAMGIHFEHGWQIRIYSPYSDGNTIAVCPLYS